VSIVELSRVHLIGPATSKAAVLEEIQRAGFLHVVSLTPPADHEARGSSAEASAALRYLQTAPILRQPVHREDIDPLEIERRALDIKAKEADLADERDYLEAKARALEPWGDFAFPELGSLGRGEHGPIRLWFYEIPTFRLPLLRERDLAWEVVARVAGTAYVVVLSDVEPADMPVPRAHTGAVSLSEVRARLARVHEELEDLTFQRAELTKYRESFAAHLDELLDRFDRSEVATKTWDDGPLFVLSGWMPDRAESELDAIAGRHHLAVTRRPPALDDNPPTLLFNRGLARAGQSLVTFYITPSYFEWDPSAVVLASFSIFFAMIVSDGGYSVLLLATLSAFWKPAGRALGTPLRNAFAVMMIPSIAWGVAVGSYFGWTPPEASILGRLNVLSIEDYDTMMKVSVSVGAFHVVIANLFRAARVPGSGALGAAGWCVAVATGLVLWLVQPYPDAAGTVRAAAPWLFGLSGVMILFFTSTSRSPKDRFLEGARALTNVTAVFGDVLSYLRLFALGLASTSLGLAFNDLAGQASGTEGVGMLFAAVILLIGHSINLGLAIMSGFVHGLRLNFIEFLRWGTTREGRPFRVFAMRRRTQTD